MSLRKRLHRTTSWAQMVLAVFGVLVVIFLVGWPSDEARQLFLIGLARIVAMGYGLAAFAEIGSAGDPRAFLRERWLRSALASCVFVSAWFEADLSTWLERALGGFELRSWLLLVAAVQQVAALASRVGEAVPWIERNLFCRISPGALLVGTFALLSLGGSLLLKMPNATVDGISFLDALFTSASAVCVTGLIVVDTATAFTPIGQLIVLILIQLGGLGIVTLTFFIALVGGQGVTVSSRVFLRDLLNSENLGRLGAAIAFIFVVTFGCELVGALLIYRAWEGEAIAGSLPWLSLFHSVSAFCNAGFSLFSNGLAEPAVAGNRLGQGVIMALIVLGGIGFPVLRELVERARARLAGARQRRSLSMHAKIALLSSAIFIALGAGLFLTASRVTNDRSWGEAAWLGLFNSITSRTAGFNISDIGAMSHAGAAIAMLLMFVGGSPGGMAGGIKTTTMSVALLNLMRILLRRRDVTLFRRRIDDHLCQRAFAVVLLSMLWILCASATIMLIQPELDFLDTVFETVSAFATVGLSRGATGELHAASKIVIIATMLVGRVGMLNFFLSLLPIRKESRLRLPTGSVIVE